MAQGARDTDDMTGETESAPEANQSGAARSPTASQGSAEARERILDAAESLFSIHGFDGTPTRLIAETAGVPKSLIFYYFPTKLSILMSVVEQRSSGLHKMQSFLHACTDCNPCSAVTGAILLGLEAMDKHRDLLRIMFRES